MEMNRGARERRYELRRVRIAALKPAPYNPRKPLKPGSPGYRRLERSLREFDCVQPVVWNERTGHLVAGHQRAAILQDQGIEEVDAVVVDLPLEREQALNVALNNAQVGSDWDAEKLTELLGELQALPDFDETLTGFDERDLRELLLAPAGPGATMPDKDEGGRVTVTLGIPAALWDEVRPALDALAAEFEFEIHVRLPRA